MTVNERFVSKIHVTGACWHYKGWKNGKTFSPRTGASGYGYFNVNGKKVRAHRFSYELFRGKIPRGKVVSHLCSVRACLNPFHLEICSSKQNTQRAALARKHMKTMWLVPLLAKERAFSNG